MDRNRLITTSTLGTPAAPTIVGIGASAGGLEALSELIRNVPADCGIAFVIVQHLDPTNKCLLPELLQRNTTMVVSPAEDGAKVKPNHVYVIPPNKDLTIRKGTLYLSTPLSLRGLRLPIDFFLRSLALDLGERAIGVILSGMGSDGTLGLQAIKERGGLVLVQDPKLAQFDSMPRSAIDAGLADIIAPAGCLPERILSFVQHPHHGSAVPGIECALQEDSLEKLDSLEQIIALLRTHTRNDFSLYKKNTVMRRVERRMVIHQLHRIQEYVAYLRGNKQELTILFRELLIGVTSFFRDPQVWRVLQEQGLPALFANYPDGKMLRGWVAGCSTGEEAYSLAIAFKEVVEQLRPAGQFSFQIFATDLDPDAIHKARLGYYPANIAADVSATRLSRFFVEDRKGYRICNEIREMVIFATQNLIMDPPFTKLDILTCRNLLIYFRQELQKKLLPLFHYSLNHNGLLLLGSAETIGDLTAQFLSVDGMTRLYRHIHAPSRSFEVEFPTKRSSMPMSAGNENPKDSQSASFETVVERALLQHFCPPAVVVNADGDILYVSGRTGKYLEPAAGKANWNIHAMAREGLRHELFIALRQAAQSKETVARRNIRVVTDGDVQTIDLHVQCLGESEAMSRMFLIVFSEVATPSHAAPHTGYRSRRNTRVMALEQSLQQARTELQIAQEESQAAQEELKSSNEELQSTNEELQSLNEELTTSKEEMQTLNSELQSKLEELSAANNDMENLLNSTDIATIFLDNTQRVRRFTPQSTRIFKLIGSDIGRPLSNIVTDLDYPELEKDIREVLYTLNFSEKSIHTRDGRWFSVRIMPYRTLDNKIDGSVMTFTNLSTIKLLRMGLGAVHQTEKTAEDPKEQPT